MKQMIKALKPCAALAFFCLVLFFAQALCGLALPALMGGLVNRGVQQGGLEPGAPEAMSLQGKTLLQSFLTEEQQRLLEELYLTVESESSEAQRLSEKYPYSQEGTIRVLREGLEEARVQEAGELYEKAVYALLLYLRQTEQTGELNTISQGLAAAREEKKEIGKFGDNLRDLEGKEGSLPNGVLTSMPEGALFQLPEESSFAEAESSSEAEAETMLGSQEKAFGEENANNGEKAGSGKENAEKQSFVFSEVGFSKLDIEQLYALLPLLDRAPRESMETVISAAEEAPRALKERVGVSFKSLLYQELRMDTEAIRSGYLWGRGLLLLGLFLLETALAVLAGLLSFRAADQTAGGRKSWALSALGLPAAGCALPTFAGALNVLLEGVTARYPRARLLLMTNYQRWPKANGLGLTELAYVDAMLEVAALWALPCFDNYRGCGLSFQNPAQLAWIDEGLSLGLPENRHFSEAAYRWLLPRYEALLEAL